MLPLQGVYASTLVLGKLLKTHQRQLLIMIEIMEIKCQRLAMSH